MSTKHWGLNHEMWPFTHNRPMNHFLGFFHSRRPTEGSVHLFRDIPPGLPLICIHRATTVTLSSQRRSLHLRTPGSKVVPLRGHHKGTHVSLVTEIFLNNTSLTWPISFLKTLHAVIIAHETNIAYSEFFVCFWDSFHNSLVSFTNGLSGLLW